MITEPDFIKTVFGLKMKQQRQKRNWSLQDLADKTRLSKSYLNEIENGKKYPKHDKIVQLAEVLECRFDDLVSTKLDKNLAPIAEILKSNFLKEIPLELFGISRNNLISIISDAPKKVTAFINTLIEISQNYNLSKERFYFAVVRSFQEMHDNFFPEIEEKAEQFRVAFSVSEKPTSTELEAILTNHFSCRLTEKKFEPYGASGKLRSLFVPENNTLILNELLDEEQKNFILAKEIGYKILNLSIRPNTYSWLDFSSFEELISNYYSSYFAGCLLINRKRLTEQLQQFFNNQSWQPDLFEALTRQFTQSPETFYYRLTNILPQDFGIRDLFYLCFTKKKGSDKIHLIKELHLNQQQAPHANATNEHYCRRWIAVKNLIGLEGSSSVTDAQISHYKDSGLSYLVISTSEKNPFSDGTNRSYCLGILLNTNSLKKINFAKSDSLQVINVGVTCEYCSIPNCEVRQAPPLRLEKEHFNEEMKKAIDKIRKEML